MMKKLGEKFYRFMYGRYGADDLYKFNVIIYAIVFIINLFVHTLYLNVLELVLLIIILYRCFSKNIYKRSKENQRYLKVKNKISKFFRIQKRKWNDRNTNIYRKCPKCKTVLKLPLKKGKHTVKCTNCSNRFEVRCRRNEKIKVEVIKKNSK